MSNNVRITTGFFFFWNPGENKRVQPKLLYLECGFYLVGKLENLEIRFTNILKTSYGGKIVRATFLEVVVLFLLTTLNFVLPFRKD